MIIRKKKHTIIEEPEEPKRAIILRNFGGCIPNVGEDCIRKAYRFQNRGTVWLDSGICHNCENKPCHYYTKWKEGFKRAKQTD